MDSGCLVAVAGHWVGGGGCGTMKIWRKFTSYSKVTTIRAIFCSVMRRPIIALLNVQVVISPFLIQMEKMMLICQNLRARKFNVYEIREKSWLYQNCLSALLPVSEVYTWCNCLLNFPAWTKRHSLRAYIIMSSTYQSISTSLMEQLNMAFSPKNKVPYIGAWSRSVNRVQTDHQPQNVNKY